MDEGNVSGRPAANLRSCFQVYREIPARDVKTPNYHKPQDAQNHNNIAESDLHSQ
ncbi:unnamed protein product [Acanthoscelides obtectus]|uniref:Uncharacterized protein n=1 Tax=Acanthoscelides obtectus TaxID=200917 RepID=A0A9P0PPU6_ACAOB|nr:unnamed protein product [Acanthoscelides obtectus]CAK1627389.1 hypothetical protein AOBTE_LOCUS4564 [Acanthoscelides obtectus]